MQIYRRKFGLNFVMNLSYQLGAIGILLVGAWLLLHGRIEIGTVVAFLSGISRISAPWNELVDYFRDLTNVGVKFSLITAFLKSPKLA
jgi:ABC-type bacteriocin/lantibiotic exporter with double-glycine peptidase domain